MAESKRDEAQRRRAESRRRRRSQDDAQPERAAEPEQGDSTPDEPLETVKHAAKVAAAAAAVGAAVGAARAIAGGEHEDERPSETAPEPDEPSEEPEPPQPAAEHEQPQEAAREEREEEPTATNQQDDDGTQPSGASPDEARRVVASAREALAALVGKDADSVSGLDRNGDGWLVTLEVVELERIPSSTDVLASYELELDRDRKLVRYRRGRRYYRSQADDGDMS
jgi:hypothetical protein